MTPSIHSAFREVTQVTDALEKKYWHYRYDGDPQDSEAPHTEVIHDLLVALQVALHRAYEATDEAETARRIYRDKLSLSSRRIPCK